MHCIRIFVSVIYRFGGYDNIHWKKNVDFVEVRFIKLDRSKFASAKPPVTTCLDYATYLGYFAVHWILLQYRDCIIDDTNCGITGTCMNGNYFDIKNYLRYLFPGAMYRSSSSVTDTTIYHSLLVRLLFTHCHGAQRNRFLQRLPNSRRHGDFIFLLPKIFNWCWLFFQAKAGILLNVVSVLIVTTATLSYGNTLFIFNEFPAWAQRGCSNESISVLWTTSYFSYKLSIGLFNA